MEYVKMVSILTIALLFYYKISDTKITPARKIVIGACYIGFIFLLSLLLSEYSEEPYKSIGVIFLSTVCIFKITKISFENALIYMALSFSLSYITYLLSLLISAFLLQLFFDFYGNNIRITIVSCALSLLISIILTIKKVNISLAQKRGIGGIGMAISGIVFIIYSITREEISQEPLHCCLLVSSFVR